MESVDKIDIEGHTTVYNGRQKTEGGRRFVFVTISLLIICNYLSCAWIPTCHQTLASKVMYALSRG